MLRAVEIAGFGLAGASLDEARRKVACGLASAGIATPALDARLLVMAACGVSHAGLIARGSAPLSAKQAARLAALARRRLCGEPVARILGMREFWGMDFRLSPATLDPRPDTETLVQAVLDAMRGRKAQPLRVLDLGTGTGCILVALLRELPRAHGIGVDISHAALETARENAARHGVGARAGFVRTDWLAGIGGMFDVVVSNPPYIARREIAGLSTEVRTHDPIAALDGGADGLAAYRAILPGLHRALAPGGVAAFEAGQGQAQDVSALIADCEPAPETELVRDLSGIGRVVVARAVDVDEKTKKQLESGVIHDSL